MAAKDVNTGDEGENDPFEFIQWVSHHDLDQIKPFLVKHNMTTASALNPSSEEYVQLISDRSLYQTIVVRHVLPKLMKAMQTIPSVNPKPKVIRIVVSKEEEEAMETLNKYSTKLHHLTQQMTASDTQLTQNTKECDQKIQESFNQFIKLITSKQQQIRYDLTQIENKKRAKIQQQTEKLHDEQKKIHNALKTCMALQEDQSMDRKQRTQQIVSKVQNLMSEKATDHMTSIDITIEFSFNQETASSFIDSMAYVLDCDHPVPLIQDIECKSITYTAATVHFDAVLDPKDENTKYLCELYMKLEFQNDDELDEKEKDVMELPMIKFDKNKKHYQLELDTLRRDTCYMMRINVCRLVNDKLKRMIGCKPISFQFKTLSHDIDIHFNYASDFDANGICYALGTNFGTKTWENPSKNGLIAVRYAHGTPHNVEYVVGRGNAHNYVSNDHKITKQYFTVDFGVKLKLKPNYYSLKHGDGDNSYCIRNWRFEGSNDGVEWTVLKNHENDCSLNVAYGTCSWPIFGCTEYYKMFRIYHCGKNKSSTEALRCCGFEVYGHLIGDN
eukprot:818828_1